MLMDACYRCHHYDIRNFAICKRVVNLRMGMQYILNHNGISLPKFFLTLNSIWKSERYGVFLQKFLSTSNYIYTCVEKKKVKYNKKQIL